MILLESTCTVFSVCLGDKSYFAAVSNVVRTLPNSLHDSEWCII